MQQVCSASTQSRRREPGRLAVTRPVTRSNKCWQMASVWAIPSKDERNPCTPWAGKCDRTNELPRLPALSDRYLVMRRLSVMYITNLETIFYEYVLGR
jgi:hypothetical protein